ncbi:MAG: UDP-N-acetylmuramoyl-tripeptide--D-alanyl-D-alanine ligase [Alphaproteobacteria bacterium]|nr:UDP-N-acetylmuramoyl-tripeptide--D-alanyl-D-alanine ligase [Alphaproteobacteria bacterium]
MTINALWTATEIAGILSAQVTRDWSCHGLSIDSRTCEEGDLFFALSGPNSDGHDYVRMAIAKGAVAAVVSTAVTGLDPALLIRVDDVKTALTTLGRAGRVRVDIPVIAITGSVGKTGIKEALKKALGRSQKIHASRLSYNNDIGVPLSLARMPRDADFGVFELGMNHAGELGPLSKMVRPAVAIISNVELAHGEYFRDIAEIADAKAEIFDGLAAGGSAILNRDNPQYHRLRAKAEQAGVENIITFGADAHADVHILRQVCHDTCSCIIAKVMGDIMTFKVGIPGQHWIINSLAVLAAVAAVGGDLGLAGLALAEMQALKGRGRRHQVFLDASGESSLLLIDESYNANPASVTAAIETLARTSAGNNGRRIAVLGDMAELGTESDAVHGDLAPVITAAAIDRVYTVGPHMSHLSRRLAPFRRGGHFDSRTALEASLIRDLRSGDVVMVKGSRVSAMDKVVDRIVDMEIMAAKRA